MSFVDLNQIADREVVLGFHGKFVHSEQVTVAFWDIEAGATLPEHSHVHEQITSVLSGRFELTVQGETRILDPGHVAVIPSHAVHGGRALTVCRIIDVFEPVRDDYR
jgi:quercetin dioxygenase-like cupin family protein